MTVVDLSQSGFANARRPSNTQFTEDTEPPVEARKLDAEAGVEHHTLLTMTVVDLPQSGFANARRPSNTQFTEDTEPLVEARKLDAEAGVEHHTAPAAYSAADDSNDPIKPVAEDGGVSKMVTPSTATKTSAANLLLGNRCVLYATAAIVVLAGVGMGTMIWEMSRAPGRPTLPSEVGAGPVPPAPLMAQSAQIARVPAPAVARFDDTRPTHPSQPNDQLQEMLAARNSGTPISVPVVVAQAPSAFPDSASAPLHVMAVAPTAPAIPPRSLKTTATLPPPTTAAPVVDFPTPRTPVATTLPTTLPPVPAVAKPDVADQAARLQAAPMTPTEEVSVLHLVTEEASMIRMQRQELADLHAEQDRLTQRVDRTFADYGRRLELAEATRAVSEAGGVSTLALPPARVEKAVRHVVQPVPSLPIEPADGPHRYRVQAASPHLAMLADVDQPQGADGLAVSVGDLVPGFGHVTAISQRGTQWVVKTDHGVIQ